MEGFDVGLQLNINDEIVPVESPFETFPEFPANAILNNGALIINGNVSEEEKIL